jgi:putative transposase
MDELHLDFPFAGSRMLRDLLTAEGFGAEIREWSDFALSRRGQAIRRETGMPRPVMMFSTLQATLASVFCVGRVRA